MSLTSPLPRDGERPNRSLPLLAVACEQRRQRDVSGHVTQLITVTRDITALVQQQQKLDALHQADSSSDPKLRGG